LSRACLGNDGILYINVHQWHRKKWRCFNVLHAGVRSPACL
jgi:hypothetical protein